MNDKVVSALEQKNDCVDEALRRIEVALRDIASDCRDLRKQISDLSIKVAGMEGQLRSIPTALQLLLALITTWAAGAAIVFALLKATHP